MNDVIQELSPIGTVSFIQKHQLVAVVTIIKCSCTTRGVGTRASMVNSHVLYHNPRHSRLSWGAVIVEVDTVLQSVTTFPPINSDIGEIARATIGEKTGVRTACTTTINNGRCSSAICTKGNGRQSRTIQRGGTQNTSCYIHASSETHNTFSPHISP